MENNKYVLGISGCARVGKDLFCSMLLESFEKAGWNARRFALADRLKEDLNTFLIAHTGIDIFDCRPEEKELVRPLLVDYGAIKRKQSNGTYWTGKLQEEIAGSGCEVAIVSDIRYDRYPEDEVFWIKKTMGGILVHISRYDMVDGKEVFVQPPNEDEMEEDPKMSCAADFRIEWETCDAPARQVYVNKFLKFVLPLVEISQRSRGRKMA